MVEGKSQMIASGGGSYCTDQEAVEKGAVANACSSEENSVLSGIRNGRDVVAAACFEVVLSVKTEGLDPNAATWR